MDHAPRDINHRWFGDYIFFRLIAFAHPELDFAAQVFIIVRVSPDENPVLVLLVRVRQILNVVKGRRADQFIAQPLATARFEGILQNRDEGDLGDSPFIEQYGLSHRLAVFGMGNPRGIKFLNIFRVLTFSHLFFTPFSISILLSE
jgi:hypothetical protein